MLDIPEKKSVCLKLFFVSNISSLYDYKDRKLILDKLSVIQTDKALCTIENDKRNGFQSFLLNRLKYVNSKILKKFGAVGD